MIKNKPIFSKKPPLAFVFVTLLTGGRVVLTPVVIWAMAHLYWEIACLLFGVAAISDGLDGWCARRFRAESPFGAMLDPIADKVFVLGVVFALVCYSAWPVPAWIAWALLAREIILLGGSAVIFLVRGPFAPRPSVWGKLTTLFALLIFSWVLLANLFTLQMPNYFPLVWGVLCLCAFFSLIHYAKIVINGERDK